MKTIYQIRYWLELIALPVFAFLVFHMSGHGIKDLIFTNIATLEQYNMHVKTTLVFYKNCGIIPPYKYNFIDR